MDALQQQQQKQHSAVQNVKQYINTAQAWPLRTWLRNNHMCIATQTDKHGNPQNNLPYTHLLMCGQLKGIIRVPDDKNQEFLKIYAQDAENGVVQFISEQRTEVFKEHFDLDLKTLSKDGPVSLDTITCYVKEIQKVIARFYPNWHRQNAEYFLEAIVAVAEPKEEIEKVPLSFSDSALDLSHQTAAGDGEVNSDSSGNSTETTTTVGEASSSSQKQVVEQVIVTEQDGTVVPMMEIHVIKTGVHVHFPYLKVNAHYARMIREAVVSHFYNVFGRRPEWNSWETVIDEHIYITSGIRMLYSNKAKKCPQCKNVELRRQNCDYCNTYGKIDEGRPYLPKLVLGGNGEPCKDKFDHLSSDKVWAVKCTSIRCGESENLTPGWTAFEGAPMYAPVVATKQTGRRRGARAGEDDNDDGRTHTVTEFKEDAKGMSHVGRNKVEVSSTNPIYDELVAIIRTRVNPHYARIVPSKLFRNADSTYYWMTVKGEGSNYCMNKQGDHNNNRIYFYITQDGIHQKCWCTCPVKRKFGNCECKHFKSKPEPINENLKKRLFRLQVGGGGGDVNNFMVNENVMNGNDAHVARLHQSHEVMEELCMSWMSVGAAILGQSSSASASSRTTTRSPRSSSRQSTQAGVRKPRKTSQAQAKAGQKTQTLSSVMRKQQTTVIQHQYSDDESDGNRRQDMMADEDEPSEQYDSA